MTGAELNDAIEQARTEILTDLEEPLAAAYAKLIRRFARKAKANYLAASAGSGVVVAAARPDELYDPTQLTADVKHDTARLRRSAVERMVDGVLTAAGISFDTAPLLVPALLDHIGVRARDLDKSMADSLRKTIETAVAQGWTVPETAAEIQAGLYGIAGYTATALARTDLIGLANGGSIVAAREVMGDGATKTWLATPDDRTRETHLDADGQTVPMDAQFEVGDDLLDYPGDPNGSDEEVINCRCTVIYNEADAVQASAATHEEEGTMKGSALIELTAGEPEVRIPILANGEIIGHTSGSFSGGDFTVTSSTAPNASGAVGTFAVAAAPAEADTPNGTPWVSDVAFEGVATGDGRWIKPGGLTWREPPLTLMAQTVTADGHDGAMVAGRMDTFARDTSKDMNGGKLPAGVAAIRSTGVFDDQGENGAEIARMVEDETLRGVSVDLSISEWAFRDPDTGEILDPETMDEAQWERAFFGELEYAILAAEIMATTVCPTPAFGDARIAVVTASADGERTVTATLWAPIRLVNADVEVITASAAGHAPLRPPLDWFKRPDLTGLTPKTVTDDGHVYGHFAGWASCHVGKGGCLAPPRVNDLSMFMQGCLTTEEGHEVAVGTIVMDTDHGDVALSGPAARRRYDDTGLAVADVVVGMDEFGYWFSGAIRPDLSEEKLRAFKAANLSGDWRPVQGQHQLVGILTCNMPGYTIPRPQAVILASAEDDGDDEIGTVLAAGLVLIPEPDEGKSTDAIRMRVLAARAEGGLPALAEIAR